MSNTISIRKGLNIRLVGESTKEIKDIPVSSTVCLSPLDFHGLIPKMVVKEGESVQVGDTVFQDKKNEKIKRQYLDERFYNLFNVTHIGIIDFDNNY